MPTRFQTVPVRPTLGLKRRSYLSNVMQEDQRRQTLDLRFRQRGSQCIFGAAQEMWLKQQRAKDERDIGAVMSEMMETLRFTITR
jgi:hypothetical protein